MSNFCCLPGRAGGSPAYASRSMDIPTLIFGTLGIAATIVIGALSFPASSPGEFWLIRSLFFGSALLLAAIVFIVQWMTESSIDLGRTFLIGFVGFFIFAGLAACLDWTNRKEAEARKVVEVVSTPSPTTEDNKSEPGEVSKRDPPADRERAGHTARTESAEVTTHDGKTRLPPLIVTFRDGRAQVSFSMNHHVEPADAPLAVVTFGDQGRVVEVLSPRVTRTVLATLEPLSTTEARSRRGELEREIAKRLRAEFKKSGITVDSFSLNQIEPR